jgi:hypothetical protein
MVKFFLIIGAVVFLSLLGSVDAISVGIEDSYELGESVMAEISGNILEPITMEDVKFMRGHIEVPFDYGVEKLGERYFLWAVSPENVNNYTLVVKVSTTVEGQVQETEFMKNFSVLGNLSDYSVRPGAFSVRNDFEITVKLNEDFDKTINVDFPAEREVVLKPGLNKIGFSVEGVEPGFRSINVGKYNVPVHIVSEEVYEEEEIEVSEGALRFKPLLIEGTLLKGEGQDYAVSLVNLEETEINNVIIEYDTELFSLSQDFVATLGPEEELEINVTLKPGMEEEIDETISVFYGSFSATLLVKINFTEKAEDVSEPYVKPEAGKVERYDRYCLDLNGRICTANEVCSGEEVIALDGRCCTAACRVEEEAGIGLYVGIVIIVVVLIVVVVIYLKYKKVKAVSPLKKIKERAKGLP